MHKLRVRYEGHIESSCGEKRNGEKGNVHSDMSGIRKRKERKMNEMLCQVYESGQSL